MSLFYDFNLKGLGPLLVNYILKSEVEFFTNLVSGPGVPSIFFTPELLDTLFTEDLRLCFYLEPLEDLCFYLTRISP